MAGVFVVDDEFKTEDGDYVFPNIIQANSQYADDDGVEYYCTATNDFGTIRSPTVRAFYAGMPTPLISAVDNSINVSIAFYSAYVPFSFCRVCRWS